MLPKRSLLAFSSTFDRHHLTSRIWTPLQAQQEIDRDGWQGEELKVPRIKGSRLPWHYLKPACVGLREGEVVAESLELL